MYFSLQSQKGRLALKMARTAIYDLSHPTLNSRICKSLINDISPNIHLEVRGSDRWHDSASCIFFCAQSRLYYLYLPANHKWNARSDYQGYIQA